MLKKCLLFLFFGLLCQQFYSQSNDIRIEKIKIKLDSLSKSIKGLDKQVDFSLSDTELPVFIRAIAAEHKLNVSIAPELNQIKVSQNFSNATVKTVFVYLCKEYSLKLDVIGNILSFKKYIIPYVPRDIGVKYNVDKDEFSVNLKNDTLYVAFKKITERTGKNLVFTPGLENQKISAFIKEKPFESAIDKIAFANNLSVTKTKDNYYLFEKVDFEDQKGLTDRSRQKPARRRNNSFYFKVQDSIKKIIDVDFKNIPVASVINEIGYDIGVDMFTTTPITGAGNATVKAEGITYDQLLTKILENTKFSFKKVNDIYFFGAEDKPSLQSSVTVPLLHRAIEIMAPMQSNQNLGFNGAQGFNDFNTNQGFNSNFNQNNNRFNNNVNRTNQNRNINQNRGNFQDFNNNSEAILDLIPKSIKDGLEITTDVEQNAFLVNGNAQKIEAFKKFLKTIDKPIPVILIEVMIIEVSNSNTVTTGIDLGIGEAPTNDNGTVFPSADLTLGATSINKIIGGFNNFGALNVGRVTPNFYARIQALETNGDINIRSTPKLSTLNGHQATLSRGERTFFAVTQRNTIGTQNPVIADVTNYFPIDADLSIAIRPLVAGDGNITLSINVTQSDFNGERIDPQAPPGMNSRQFTSTVRVKDKDLVILGGIEENSRNNSGSGVPFLARVPLVKYLFSKRVRTARKSKLSVLIKPTIIK